MFNVILSLVIAVSGIWVYLDATKNKIGKIEGEKGMFNMSAGAWAIVTLLLWIVGFPAYLIKRKSLIEKSIDNPVNVSGKWVKVAGLAVIGLLLVAAPLTQMPMPQLGDGIMGGGDSITCTGADVQNLTIQIINEELIVQMLPSYIKDNYEALHAELTDKEVFTKYLDTLVTAYREAGKSWDHLKRYSGMIPETPLDKFIEYTKVSPFAASLYQQMLQNIKNSNPSLVGIRVQQNQPEIKKVSCAADIKFANGKEYPITYEAQITEDGQIYVEVSGL